MTFKDCAVIMLMALLPIVLAQNTSYKVVCNYDSRSFHRLNYGKFLPADLENVLGQCTHLLYGYAGLDGSEFKIKSLDPDLDTEIGKENYKAVTSFKKRFPGLNVILSIGGWADKEESEKYLALLRDPAGHNGFISSIAATLKKYGFDGIDLAWQFPLVRVKQRSQLGSIWHKIKKTFGYAKSSRDLMANEHRAGFTTLIKEMKSVLRPDGYTVTASVIPHTNYTLYWDLHETVPYLDGIHIQAFDYLTAEKKITPEVADYPAPLHASNDRNPNFNVATQIKWFLDNGAPPQKLVLGIPTHGRSWRLDSNSAASGIPPIEANGEGTEGQYTNEKGLFSQEEICSLLLGNNMMTSVTDPNKRLGTYAWRPDTKVTEGMWIGYDDEDTAREKAEYAKKLRLGGVGIYDLSMDDFRGVCKKIRNPFPLLQAAKAGLQ